MADIFDKVVNEQDSLKKILAKIPGFSGYVERVNRRSADKLLRDTIADHFEILWQRVSSLQRDMISNGKIEKIQDVEAASLKLRQFIDRVRSAAYGYAGFFDAVKIDTKALATIYQYDLQMLNLESEVNQAIENVASSLDSDGETAAIRHLVAECQRCLDVFDKRKEAVINSTGDSAMMTPPVVGN